MDQSIYVYVYLLMHSARKKTCLRQTGFKAAVVWWRLLVHFGPVLFFFAAAL